jgi:hypothetical protein
MKNNQIKFYKKNYKYLIYLIFLIYITPIILLGKEDLYFYEEALKTERVSSLLSIPLYEEFLKNNPPKKYSEAVVGRLFDLYMMNNKYDDLIILNEFHKIDKIRKKRLEELYIHLSNSFGISLETFSNLSNLAPRKDNNSLISLVEMYNIDRNKYMLSYIFAVKLKLNDFESIQYILNNITDINPILKIIYYVKINSTKLKSGIEEVYRSNNTDEIKKELFFLYGIHLSRIKRFKEAIRYYRMSNSFAKNENTNNYPKATIEISKNLFIKGFSSEACKNISDKKIIINNESDEFIKIYCDSDRNKELKNILPAIKFYAKKDYNLIFKRYLNEIKD